MRIRRLLPFLSILLFTDPALASGKDLAQMLPETPKLEQAVPAGEPELATGEKLFERINGGAVLFLKHGFREALFQEYRTGDDGTVNLEIYQMNAPAGAKGVFTEQADPSAKKMALGDQGVQGDYYCAFYRGAYYVTVTGSASTQAMRQLLLDMARAVDQRIRAGDAAATGR